jgi:hypothetical protein
VNGEHWLLQKIHHSERIEHEDNEHRDTAADFGRPCYGKRCDKRQRHLRATELFILWLFSQTLQTAQSQKG